MIYIYIEVNNGNESDSMKKIEKQSNPKMMNYYNGKSMLKRFSFSSPGDLPEAMNDTKEWQEKVRDICADGTTWWWWF